MILARIAYETYYRESQGKSLLNGKPLPHWTRLPGYIKTVWATVAGAVKDAKV